MLAPFGVSELLPVGLERSQRSYLVCGASLLASAVWRSQILSDHDTTDTSLVASDIALVDTGQLLPRVRGEAGLCCVIVAVSGDQACDLIPRSCAWLPSNLETF